jgi:hypothetical protein
MIIGSIIFFDSEVHKKIIYFFRNFLIKFYDINKIKDLEKINLYKIKMQNLNLGIVVIFFVIQLSFPIRYAFYPGELFWNEQGYRFSWRVMLMEKMGYSTFKIVDQKTGKFFYVNNEEFLTPFQEKQMSFQPDFILEYANYLGDVYTKRGHKNVQVFTDSYVALNGRLSQRFIDHNVNLYGIKESFKHKNWILPFNDEIKGL